MINDVMRGLMSHSSVRSFTDQPIDSELLQALLRCGQSASSSSFIQAYSVVRVSGEENRKIIAKAAGNQRWVIEAAEFLVFCADMKRIEYACEKFNRGKLEGYTEHFITATIDTALMAQTLLVAAESAGLGGVFVGGIRNNPEAVAECLQLPDLVYPVFGMCLGWPDAQPETKPRFPASTILHQDRYDSASISQQVDMYDQQMNAYYANRDDNSKLTNWSEQTANAVQGKVREHMLSFLQQRGFLKR